jgi:uroporphyrin-III C-methyltransferase
MIVRKTSKVILAGAGPGDPELISIKASRAISSADVILYDALVNEEILAYAGANSKLIYVGKRKGQSQYTQDQINELILYYSTRYDLVLRLKGGDPFVYGRGHEELEYLQKHGVKVEVIPGISSALAAPTSIGIPLTKRGVNESFWVITGMLASGVFSWDLELAAKSSATVVVLMGTTHLDSILNLFAVHRCKTEPAAIIQSATCPDQKGVIGNVSNLSELVKAANITSPAVIVIGNVVNQAMLSEIVQHKEVKMKVAV